MRDNKIIFTILIFSAISFIVTSIEKRQTTRLETKCMKKKGFVYRYYKAVEKCFQFLFYDSYVEAINKCKGMGAQLATFKSDDHKILAYNYLDELYNLTAEGYHTYFFIGLDKRQDGVTFRWIDDGQPIKNASHYIDVFFYTEDDCVIMYTQHKDIWTCDCEDFVPFFCEIR
uniref:C-type lectin domain-containing protein n=1 Tax=Biomphalaria glabrata TaxID=6526 RepID=A0A2C9KLK9_BIOGL